MVLNYFFKGIFIGFSIAAPVGPIGILTIQRSLAHGALAGLATGIGAATADAVYGCIAGFGLTFVTRFLLAWNRWLLLAGSLFLCGLGLRHLFRQPRPPAQKSAQPFSSYGSAYVSALFLTLTNPMTILAFTVIFAGLGVAGEDHLSAGMLVLGVFLGSSLWWVILAFGADRIKGRIKERVDVFASPVAGGILLLFGLWSLVRAAG